jgi:hypothetical protein
VKIFVSGFVCACVVWLASNAPAAAQQPPAPPAPTAPQPAPGEEPPDQDQGQEQQGGTLTTLPELPKIPDVQMPGEKGVSIGLTLWNGNAKPELEKGSFDYAYLGNIRMMGNPKIDQGFDVKVPLGLHNIIWASFMGSRASGNVYAPSELGLITQVYLQGDYLATDYRITSYKLGYDYLAWPYPSKTSRFRLKTRWSMQFLRARIGFDAPLVPTLASNPSDQNLSASYAAQHTYQFYLPEAGLFSQYWLSRGVRLDMGGEGMSFPHHQNSWDFEGSLNFRAGHYELQIGYRGYHFRTSAQQDFWVRGTMVGPIVGLHWYSDSMTK